MSAAPVTRAITRQSRLFLRRNNIRHASTTSEAATKAQETGKQAVSKAQESGQQAVSKASEGLSRVQSSASSTISNVGSSAYNVVSRIGGRTGRAIQFVESLIPPSVYYSRVGFELFKMIARGQGFRPPTAAQFQSYFQPIVNVARNPRSLMSTASSTANSMNPETVLSQVRNVNARQMATVGIVFAELLGFFTIGEMIGRMKLVGYHGEAHHEH